MLERFSQDELATPNKVRALVKAMSRAIEPILPHLRKKREGQERVNELVGQAISSVRGKINSGGFFYLGGLRANNFLVHLAGSNYAFEALIQFNASAHGNGTPSHQGVLFEVAGRDQNNINTLFNAWLDRYYPESSKAMKTDLKGPVLHFPDIGWRSPQPVHALFLKELIDAPIDVNATSVAFNGFMARGINTTWVKDLAFSL